MHLGYIGVGKMGSPMAVRLLDAGHTLTVFDSRAAAMKPFTDRGARAAASVAAVAREVETVLVCLPTPEIVRKVAAEIAGAGGKVRTFVDLSTTGPRVETEVAALLREKGIIACDSPVSGGVAGAAKGTLAVMLACPQDRREVLAGVLAALGKVFYLGDKPGLGQTMKLANNMLSAAAMAISCEAIVMGVKGGLDAKQMVEIINAGSGRNTATEQKFPKSILTRNFDYGFTNALMYKDVKLCTEVAEELGVPMWVGAAVRQVWANAVSHLGPDTDFSQVVKLVEEWAGVEVKGT